MGKRLLAFRTGGSFLPSSLRSNQLLGPVLQNTRRAEGRRV